MDASLGIVVPAYRPDVDRLAAYLRELDQGLSPDVLRVELDAPEAGVGAALGDAPGTVHSVPDRRGKGAAVTAGFEALDTDLLGFVDADGSTPVDSFADVLAPLPDDAALAVGSRRHPEATVTSHQTSVRRRLGDAFAWVARRSLDVSLYDYQCGAKALTRDAWRTVRSHLYEPGFSWDVELVAMTAALDLRIVEVPIEWHDQPGSTVAPGDALFEFARTLVLARHRARRLQDSSIHAAIATRGEERRALVNRK